MIYPLYLLYSPTYGLLAVCENHPQRLMSKLDEIAVNIELVLISLIEGVALVILGEHIVKALEEPDWYRYIAFGLAGLAILLVFWAQSIMHAISFIRWPVRVEHMFLYFTAGLAQILAYSHILSLDGWFFWWAIFSLIALGMYMLDLWIVRDSYPKFEKISGGKEFLEKVEERHLFEMKYLVPLALGFNVLMWITALVVPKFFQPWWIYEIPGTLQFVLSAYALYDCSKNFRIRSEMISNLFEKQKA